MRIRSGRSLSMLARASAAEPARRTVCPGRSTASASIWFAGLSSTTRITARIICPQPSFPFTPSETYQSIRWLGGVVLSDATKALESLRCLYRHDLNLVVEVSRE